MIRRVVEDVMESLSDGRGDATPGAIRPATRVGRRKTAYSKRHVRTSPPPGLPEGRRDARVQHPLRNAASVASDFVRCAENARTSRLGSRRVTASGDRQLVRILRQSAATKSVKWTAEQRNMRLEADLFSTCPAHAAKSPQNVTAHRLIVPARKSPEGHCLDAARYGLNDPPPRLEL